MPFRRTNFMTRRQMREAMSIRSFHEKFIALIAEAQAYTKFWVGFAGGVLAIVTVNIPIDPQVSKWIVTGIAIATAFSVYKFPNVIPPVIPVEHVGAAEMSYRQALADDADQANAERSNN